MKTITINTKKLLNAVANANNYTSKDGDYKGSIVLVGNNSKLEVKATDLIQTMVFKNIDFVSSDITEPNFDAFSIDAKKLTTVLKAAKSEEVLIELNKGFVTIKSNRSRIKIETFATAQEIKVLKGYGKPLELCGNVEAMENLFHAIDTNNPKYELNGLLIQVKDKKINLVATDTRRLALVSRETTMQDLEIIIPKYAINTIKKHFNTLITAEADEVMLTIDNMYQSYSTKLINGKFPDYNRIIPKEFSQTVSLKKESFIEAVEEASMFEEEILISIKNQILTTSDLSKNTEVFISDETINKDIDIEFVVNAKYIIDFISSIKLDTIELCFNGHNIPFVLKAHDFQEVIVPIILPEESIVEEKQAA